MEILRIDNLTKRFGGFTAVNDISLSVQAGEICGFLGPNGAGKTTTFKMIAGLLKPDGGTILINGRDLAADPAACKRETGYVPDRPWLYEKLTGLEFLQFIASLYTLEEGLFQSAAARLLRLFDLAEWQDHLIESYSHGMRQKLVMTSVLMLDQPLLVIDEPMVGLDPKSARLVKELFKQRARNGTAVFLSTHSLEIAEDLCHRIIIITEGRLRTAGTMEELRAEAGRADSGLEDIFLALTGAWELQQVIAALRDRS
ncbi:MAG TPA: ABC transporter ATP-binding protein [Desulfobacteraceae bacterium]|nr:ABC transporter ATP-binding protein [Desulfobacteraceae bacterium]